MDSEVGACSDFGSLTKAGEDPEEELKRGMLSVTEMDSGGGTSKVGEAGWGPMSIMASSSCGTACESSAAFASEAEVVAFNVPVIGVAGVAVALKGSQQVVTLVTMISYLLSLFLADSHLTKGSSKHSFFFDATFFTSRFGTSGIGNCFSISASHFLRQAIFFSLVSRYSQRFVYSDVFPVSPLSSSSPSHYYPQAHQARHFCLGFRL